MNGFYTIGLLIVANIFMTFAWYGHLNPSLTGIIIFHKFSVCFEGFRFAKYLIISRSVF